MSRKRPTEVSWDSDDDLLKDDLPSVSAFPQSKSNEDFDDLDEDELLGFDDDSDVSKKNNSKPRNSVFNRLAFTEPAQPATLPVSSSVKSRLGSAKSTPSTPAANSISNTSNNNSAIRGSSGISVISSGGQKKVTPKSDKKKKIMPIVFTEPEPEPEPELILDIDESLDFGLDDTQEFVSESILDTSQSEDYGVMQDNGATQSFVEEVEEEQNVSQETSAIEEPEVETRESSDESESDDEDSRRGRFKSERTHVITTIKTSAQKPKGDIPDTLEISTEQQAEIDQFLQHDRNRYNQRGRGRRGGRGRGVQGRLGPPMSKQQGRQQVPSIVNHSGQSSNPHLASSHGQIPSLIQSHPQQQQQPPKPQPQRIHVNPHFRGSNPNRSVPQNMGSHPPPGQYSHPQQMVPHSQPAPQPLLQQPMRPPQPQQVMPATSHGVGWAPPQQQRQPPYPVHNGPPTSQPRFHHPNNQPYPGPNRPPSSGPRMAGMPPGQHQMSPGQQQQGPRTLFPGHHVHQSPQGPQQMMQTAPRPPHVLQNSSGYDQYPGQEPHFRPPNNNQFHPPNNQFSQQPHEHFQHQRMPPPQQQPQGMMRGPNNNQFDNRPRGPPFQQQQQQHQQRFQQPPRQPMHQQPQHHHQGPPQQFRHPQPQRNVQGQRHQQQQHQQQGHQQHQQQHFHGQQHQPNLQQQQHQQQFQQNQRPQLRPQLQNNQQQQQFGNRNRPPQNTALLQHAKKLQERARKFQSQQIPVIGRTAQKRPASETNVQPSPPKQLKSVPRLAVQQVTQEVSVDSEIQKKLAEQARLREQIRKRKEANRLAEAKKKREELVHRLAEKGQTLEDIESVDATMDGGAPPNQVLRTGQPPVQQSQTNMPTQPGGQMRWTNQKQGQMNIPRQPGGKMAWTNQKQGQQNFAVRQQGPVRQMSNPGQGQMPHGVQQQQQQQGVKRHQSGVIQLNKNNNQGQVVRPQPGAVGEPAGKRMKKVTILRKNAQGEVIFRKTVLKPIDEPTTAQDMSQPKMERQISVGQAAQGPKQNMVRQISNNSQVESNIGMETPRTIVTKQVPANRSVVIRGGGAGNAAGQNVGQQNMNQANRRVVMGPDSGQIKTKRVLIKNLSVSTSEGIIRNLCSVIGPVESIQVNKGEKQAIVSFLNVDHAAKFTQKYNRHMVDLSHISVTLLKN